MINDKDLKKLEEVVEKVIKDLLQVDIQLDDDDEAGFPVSVLEKMEDYMGEEIMFMGIS